MPREKHLFDIGSAYCCDCAHKQKLAKETREIAKGMQQACKSFAEVCGRDEGVSSPRAGEILSEFIRLQGGANQFAARISNEFSGVMNDPLSPRKERRQWIALTTRMIQKQEQIEREVPPDLSGMTDEQLMSIIKPVAIDMLRSDPQFLKECLAGLNIHVLEHEEATT